MISDLNEEQVTTLNILKALVPMFKKYDLKYSMLGGTLLGAIRHKGFIPWDDDIDIGLPRPDYEKFFQVADKELSTPLELQSVLKGNGHYCYIRIVNTDIKLLRSSGVKDAVINAWVDVFPIDGVPNGFVGFLWRRLALVALKLFVASDFSYMAARDNDDEKERGFLRQKVRDAFEKFNLERLINTKMSAHFLNAILKSSNYNRCKRVCNFMGYWGSKEEFPKEIYDNMVKYPFEDLELYGPQNYDMVLTQMYGDYMSPPPVKDRDHHKITAIEEYNEEHNDDGSGA